jgi:hypothetical protein
MSSRLSTKRKFAGTPKTCRTIKPPPIIPSPVITATATATTGPMSHIITIDIHATDSSRPIGQIIPTDIYCLPPLTPTEVSPTRSAGTDGIWFLATTKTGTNYTIWITLRDTLGREWNAIAHCTGIP